MRSNVMATGRMIGPRRPPKTAKDKWKEELHASNRVGKLVMDYRRATDTMNASLKDTSEIKLDRR